MINEKPKDQDSDLEQSIDDKEEHVYGQLKISLLKNRMVITTEICIEQAQKQTVRVISREHILSHIL